MPPSFRKFFDFELKKFSDFSVKDSAGFLQEEVQRGKEIQRGGLTKQKLNAEFFHSTSKRKGTEPSNLSIETKSLGEFVNEGPIHFCTKIISFPRFKINTLRVYIRADFTHTRARARFILICFFLIHSPRPPWIYVTFPLHPTKAVGVWSPGGSGPAVPKAAQHKTTDKSGLFSVLLSSYIIFRILLFWRLFSCLVRRILCRYIIARQRSRAFTGPG